MSSKSKTTSDQTTHHVVAPTNPQWVTDPVQTLAGRIGDLSKLDPYSLVAGANPLQTQAGRTASGLGAWTGDDLNVAKSYGAQAGGMTQYVMNGAAPQMTASRASPFIADYMNPYLGEVVNASLADYDFGAGQTRAQNQLALANDATFGGSGGAIQTALSNDALTRGRASLAAGLRSQGFNTALGAAQSDAERAQAASLANAQLQAQQNALRLQAAAQLAGVGQTGLNNAIAYDANQRANVEAQAAIGDMLRQVEAARQTAPISLLATQSGLLNSLPLGLFHGQVEDGTSHETSTTVKSDPVGAVTSLATGLAGLMGTPLMAAGGPTLLGKLWK